MEDSRSSVVKRLDKTVSYLLDLDRSLSVTDVKVLLLVMRNTLQDGRVSEGIDSFGPSDVAKEASIPMPTASRILLDMSEKNRHGKPGRGWLLRNASDTSLSRTKYTLSPSGKKILSDLVAIWS